MLKKALHRYRYALLVLCFVGLWAAAQGLFLDAFPFVHSDEAWLGGLSRNMLQSGSMGVTEPFFDAKPRYPHAIKSLFHLLQMGFIRLFGYEITTLRALSVVGGALCLVLFYFAALRVLKTRGLAFLATVVLSVDIQFLYASHFARQEILLCALLVACLVLLLRGEAMPPLKRALCLAVLTGLGVGLHPNSFLIATMCGLCLLREWLQNRKIGGRALALYVLVTACFAAVFVAISFAFDAQFPMHYLAYGQSEFELLVPLGEKASGLFGFFARLFTRQSGTYYLPDIRLQLLVFPACALLCLAFALVMRKEQPQTANCLFTLLLAGAGLLAGMVLIGRYNQTSILFLFPIGWLLTAFACRLFGQRLAHVLLAFGVAAVLFISVQTIRPWLTQPSYQSYVAQIQTLVPKDARVLGNLNADFAFENGNLRDYRNLPFALAQSDMAAYIRQNDIRYILYSDELDYLYAHRPYYNVIYGNAMFCEALRRFCLESCEEIGSFQNSVYGARIMPLVGDAQYGNVRVFRVKNK